MPSAQDASSVPRERLPGGVTMNTGLQGRRRQSAAGAVHPSGTDAERAGGLERAPGATARRRHNEHGPAGAAPGERGRGRASVGNGCRARRTPRACPGSDCPAASQAMRACRGGAGRARPGPCIRRERMPSAQDASSVPRERLPGGVTMNTGLQGWRRESAAGAVHPSGTDAERAGGLERAPGATARRRHKRCAPVRVAPGRRASQANDISRRCRWFRRLRGIVRVRRQPAFAGPGFARPARAAAIT